MNSRALSAVLVGYLCVGPVLAAEPPAASSPAPAAADATAAPAAPAKPVPPTPQSRAVMSQVEKRITDLHDKLHITASEQKLWQDFSDMMRQNAREMDQMAQQRHDALRSMTAVADMQSYADLTAAHAAQVQKLVPSFASLYDAMSPTQKKQADDIFKAFQTQAAAGRH